MGPGFGEDVGRAMVRALIIGAVILAGAALGLGFIAGSLVN